HPIRRIKELADAELARLSPVFRPTEDVRAGRTSDKDPLGKFPRKKSPLSRLSARVERAVGVVANQGQGPSGPAGVELAATCPHELAVRLLHENGGEIVELADGRRDRSPAPEAWIKITRCRYRTP